jgi:hypothetical protein
MHRLVRLIPLFALFVFACSGGGGHSGGALPFGDGQFSFDGGGNVDLAHRTGDGGGGGGDMMSSDGGSNFPACCGKPGDPGNDYGVGLYCTQQNDCLFTPRSTMCVISSTPAYHICTRPCTQASDCGMAAQCVCSGGSCMCFPVACVKGMGC